jgi:hypothetical protein
LCLFSTRTLEKARAIYCMIRTKHEILYVLYDFSQRSTKSHTGTCKVLAYHCSKNSTMCYRYLRGINHLLYLYIKTSKYI